LNIVHNINIQPCGSHSERNVYVRLPNQDIINSAFPALRFQPKLPGRCGWDIR